MIRNRSFPMKTVERYKGAEEKRFQYERIMKNPERPTTDEIRERIDRERDLLRHGNRQQELTKQHKQILADWNSCETIRQAAAKVGMSRTALMQHIKRFRKLKLDVKMMFEEGRIDE